MEEFTFKGEEQFQVRLRLNCIKPDLKVNGVKVWEVFIGSWQAPIACSWERGDEPTGSIIGVDWDSVNAEGNGAVCSRQVRILTEGTLRPWNSCDETENWY